VHSAAAAATAAAAVRVQPWILPTTASYAAQVMCTWAVQLLLLLLGLLVQYAAPGVLELLRKASKQCGPYLRHTGGPSLPRQVATAMATAAAAAALSTAGKLARQGESS
jgi:hypothetical protein